MTLTILALGDVFGKPGRMAVRKHLPALKEAYKPDLVLANVENLSGGKGFTIDHLRELQVMGVDFFTSGNHVWRQKESVERLNEKDFPVLRPANYPEECPGRGYSVVETKTKKKVLVINVMGQVFMPNQLDSPFAAVERILQETKHERLDAIVIDFHAEVTSEKWALGHFLDGKVSLVYGTHTHVPTADARILPGKTAFITDLGMTGPYDSVIGLDKNDMVRHFLTQLPVKHEVASDDARLNAILVTIDEKTRLAESITLIQQATGSGAVLSPSINKT